MIVLDTNVVSEPMKQNGDPRVQAWLDRQKMETLHLTATSLSELMAGIELLPDGKGRERLGVALHALLARLFGARVLPFDQEAAVVYASLVSRARAKGHVLSVAEGQIAAISITHGFTVATRDTALFLAAGLPIINPWEQ